MIPLFLAGANVAAYLETELKPEMLGKVPTHSFPILAVRKFLGRCRGALARLRNDLLELVFPASAAQESKLKSQTSWSEPATTKPRH